MAGGDLRFHRGVDHRSPWAVICSPRRCCCRSARRCFSASTNCSRASSAISTARPPATSSPGCATRLVMSALVPFFWQTPSLAHGAMMLALGACGMTAHLFLTQAFRHRGPGTAGAVQLLPDHVCRPAGLAAVFPHADLDHRDRHCRDLLQRPGGGLAAKPPLRLVVLKLWFCRRKRCVKAQARAAGPAQREHQSSIFGILRGAMKYIQVSAMKYIAGIRVNSTV
jgi:hypothetical protein